jgi:hypothetical protein
MSNFNKQYYLEFGHHNDNIGVVFRHFNLMLESKKMLVVPCGYGQIVLWCISHGVNCIGVDISEFLTSIVQKPLKGVIICDDITTTDVGKEFDLVVCCDLLEHLTESEIDAAIKNIYNHMSDNGKAIIKIGVEEIKDFENDPTHVTKRPHSWWHKKIESFGFGLFRGFTEIGEAVYIKNKELERIEDKRCIEIKEDELPKNIFGIYFFIRKDGKLQMNYSKHNYIMTISSSPIYKIQIVGRRITVYDNNKNLVAATELAGGKSDDL